MINNKNPYYSYCRYHDKTSPLHIAGRIYNRNWDKSFDKPCPELARLLLEYGAKVDVEFDSDECPSFGETPLHRCIYNLTKKFLDSEYAEDPEKEVDIICEFYEKYFLEYICLLVESGAKAYPTFKEYIKHVSFDFYMRCVAENAYGKLIFLRWIKRALILNENSVEPELKRLYEMVKERFEVEEKFDEVGYSNQCLEELSRLEKLQLKEVLQDNTEVDRGYKRKYGSLVGSSGIENLYPIYGHLLKIKLRSRLLKYEEKFEK